MSNSVIEVEKLSKHFTIGERESYATFRDAIARALAAAFRPSSNGDGRGSAETLWALRDVSFEVKQGEVVGLIGRNGAGKSTLLKILARITRPTAGWARVRGRIGSLLEVGTGFHPELTGRENVFLSGAVLGMKKAEIQKKFDEIVAFSEVERFLDTPLKRYSSGMQMRLAFAVAAHLEPEILLVDEVLTVGDIAFQKKCLGKMDDVARQGRTIVFVSHQMNQIRRLCRRVIWIDAGSVRQEGSADGVVSIYEAAMSKGGGIAAGSRRGNHAKGHFTGWEVVYPGDASPHSLRVAGPVTVRFTLNLCEPTKNGIHGVALYNADRQLQWGWAAYELNLGAGCHDFIYDFPLLPLKPGIYTWYVSFWDRQELIDIGDLIPEFQVTIPSFQHSLDEWTGSLNLPSEFTVRPSSAACSASHSTSD